MDLSMKSLEELQLLAKIHNINVPGNHRSKKMLENYLYKNINFKISNYQLVLFLDIKIDSEFVVYTKNCLQYIKEYIDNIVYILFEDLEFETFDIDKIKIDRIRIIFQRKTPFTFDDFYFCKQLYKDNYILLQELFLNPLEKNILKFGFPENFTFDLDLESIFMTVL